jgi:hypothetical protein
MQQDNDPKHTSKLCTTYLEKKEVAGVLTVMKWPAQSLDLNYRAVIYGSSLIGKSGRSVKQARLISGTVYNCYRLGMKSLLNI